MSINNSTKSQYILLDMKQPAQHNAELSTNKLIMLLSILGFIWILCYNAEVQFPARHIADTYSRIGSNNITHQAYQYAIDFINNNTPPDADFQHRVYLTKKYNLTKSAERDICVILIHRPGQENWMNSIKSLLAQNYSKFKVYYLNNYEGGQEVYQYMESNSLEKRKLKIIENIQDSDYSKEYQYSKNYCQPNDLVVYMHDDDELVGQDVFTFVNAVFAKNTQLQFLYSASLIKQVKERSKKVSYRLGKSYPYPPEIIQAKKYRNYTYLVDGVSVFSNQLLSNVLLTDILDDNNKPYKHAGQIALGISLLQLAGQNIMYVPQILLLRSVDRQYVALDPEVRKQIQDISNDQ